MARFDLGLTDGEFGLLTPLLFDALLKRKRSAEVQAWLRTGTVAAMVANFSMGAPEKALKPRDFLPPFLEEGLQDAAPASEFDMRELSPEEQRDYLLRVFGKAVQHQKKG